MKTKLALFALGLLLPMFVFGQQPGQPDDTPNTVQAVSIPEDLPACMAQLDSMLGDKDKAWLRENGAVDAHFGLGRWIRNNWGLWDGDSSLSAYFRGHGIQHPVDMSGLILECPACMVQLDSMLGDKDKAWLRENGAVDAHFGLGMWIRNNWGLWGGDSSLSAYFRDHGILHPDDMSNLILECYVQHLNGEDVDYERMLGEARRVEEEWRREMEKWVER